MLQNGTPLRKSAPWPPNISNSCVSCTAPAIKKHLCRSSSNVPTCHCFWNATKPSHFAPFWQGAQSLAPATQNDIWTSKSAPYPSIFCMCDLDMCFAPQRRALFSAFSTSQLPKVVRHWSALHILTSKCASRHNGVHFLVLFRHLNFQKGSDTEVLCTFWLRNVLRATTACTFSTGQLPKAVRHWSVLCILTWECASRHNGVHFFDMSTSKVVRAWSFLYILSWTCSSHHPPCTFSSLIWPDGSAFFPDFGRYFYSKIFWLLSNVFSRILEDAVWGRNYRFYILCVPSGLYIIYACVWMTLHILSTPIHSSILC